MSSSVAKNLQVQEPHNFVLVADSTEVRMIQFPQEPVAFSIQKVPLWTHKSKATNNPIMATNSVLGVWSDDGDRQIDWFLPLLESLSWDLSRTMMRSGRISILVIGNPLWAARIGGGWLLVVELSTIIYGTVT